MSIALIIMLVIIGIVMLLVGFSSKRNDLKLASIGPFVLVVMIILFSYVINA